MWGRNEMSVIKGPFRVPPPPLNQTSISSLKMRGGLKSYWGHPA